MTPHAFFPGIDLIIFATIVLMIFKNRIKPTFKFWIYCIGISFASKVVAALLLMGTVSAFALQVDQSFYYLRFPIWLALSIIGVRLFTQKILQSLQTNKTGLDA